MGSFKNKLKQLFIVRSLDYISLQPLWMLHILAYCISFFLNHILHYRQKIIRSNLRYVFPDASRSKLSKIENQFYLHISDCIVESIKLKHMSEGELTRRLDVTNLSPINQSLESGQPIIVLLGHIGNWEWLPHFTTLFPPGIPFGEVYRRLHDNEWDHYISKLRHRWKEITLIPQKDAVKTILQWNKEGVWGAAFLSDQRPNGKNLKHWFKFFGHLTPFAIGAQSIGLKTNARFFYGFVTRPKRGFYNLEFIEIRSPKDDNDKNSVIQEYIRLLEENICCQPEIWLWSHNRWKYQSPKNINLK